MKNFRIIILAINLILLSNCAGIPGRNVKLEDYPEVIKEDLKNLSLSVHYVSFKDKTNSSGRSFVSIDREVLPKKEKNKNPNTNCVVEISSKTDSDVVRELNIGDVIRLPYYAVCTFSLFIIPCYKQLDYQAHATLISTKDNRILKEYDLKDKVHEVWSSLMFLFVLATSQTSMWDNSSIETPETAKRETANKVSEALVRSILNDAQTFEECRK